MLNMACGPIVLAGFDNSDIKPYSNSPEITHLNLDERPYPYQDGSADVIVISHGLCLRACRARILREFWRILKPNGWLRIDDNPWRFHIDGETPPAAETERGFPRFRRLSRENLKRLLAIVGFGLVAEIPTGETLIPCDDLTRHEILRNSLSHPHTFTVEARK